MSTYRAALIGCGRISHRHAKAFLAQGNVEIVAGCDINAENLQQVCDEYGIPGRYADYQEMLAQEPNLDLISVCTYPKFHAEHTIAAAQSGAKGVLCEKPMCLGVDEAQAMIDACQENDTKLAVAFRHRQNPNFTRGRELIADGAIGDPMLAWCFLGNPIIDNGSHIVDMIRYLLGEPPAEWVMGHTSRKADTMYQGSPVEEAGNGLIAFQGGTRGLIELGELVPANGFRFRVWGSEGMLEASQRGVELFDRAGRETLQSEPNDGFAEQTRELIGWIEGEPEHRSPGESGKACTEILMAIYESARIGQVVQLPLHVDGYPMLKMVGEVGSS
jgi:UDP-N-acetyl-2-amino-2-deoxyglucuronate dehydrogenase